MIFTDLGFLPFFLTVLVFANIILKDKTKFRIFFLTLSSYVFYSFWNWKLSALILISTIVDFNLGKKIYNAKTKRQAKTYLVMSLAANLGLLAFFKYFNFFLDNANFALGTSFSNWNILLPVGISFYTFQTLSYSIDIYRKHMKPEKSFLRYAFFVSFFPQLVAGPIVRAAEFLPQTRKKVKVTFEEVSEGLQIFFQGIVKKVLIANTMSIYVDAVFANPSIYSTATIWLAVIAYAFQIFCDFSGYSDMAIGTAKMLGFNLVRNFEMPYLAHNMTEFWKRWHISLSRWIRDYIYIPLGGNRKGKVRQHYNLMVTMLLAGLWHGANWNFVVWGGLHGAALSADKIFKTNERSKHKGFRMFSWVLTTVFLLVTWVFFRAEDFPTAFLMVQMMFNYTPGIDWYFRPLLFWTPIIIAAHYIGAKLKHDNKEYYLANLKTYKGLVLFFLIVLGIIILNPQIVQPFIYFQF